MAEHNYPYSGKQSKRLFHCFEQLHVFYKKFFKYRIVENWLTLLLNHALFDFPELSIFARTSTVYVMAFSITRPSKNTFKAFFSHIFYETVTLILNRELHVISNTVKKPISQAYLLFITSHLKVLFQKLTKPSLKRYETPTKWR